MKGLEEVDLGDKETLGNPALMILLVEEILEVKEKDLVVIILKEILVEIPLVEVEIPLEEVEIPLEEMEIPLEEVEILLEDVEIPLEEVEIHLEDVENLVQDKMGNSDLVMEDLMVVQ